MIVGDGIAVFVDGAPENGVGQGISCGLHLPVSVNEILLHLSCHHGVQHDGQIAAGGIFHAYTDIHYRTLEEWYSTHENTVIY